ncbi:hypothetical protein ACN38_g10148 [Penicillium nordicum]|uniref:Uncharacterized protein n=1 Tax=Penicillium nordicum TaxID=229535 RepID=A0A0M8P1Z8_9EURO|nr:hypothetical protein ACN38_g10148 [Penicillium nordicum]
MQYYSEAIATSTACVFKLNYEPLSIVPNPLVYNVQRPKRGYVNRGLYICEDPSYAYTCLRRPRRPRRSPISSNHCLARQ